MRQRIDPLAAVAAVAQRFDRYALLYTPPGLGGGSVLAYGYARTVTDWNGFVAAQAVPDAFHIGYMGYGMACGAPPLIGAASAAFPPIWMAQFEHVHHIAADGSCEGTLPGWLTEDIAPPLQALPASLGLRTTMDWPRYRACIEETLEAIRRGDFYVANITRKFLGGWDVAPDIPSLFAALCAASPARYAALLQLEPAKAMLSSSMERFLRVDENGQVSTRPIKGTAPRGASPAEDESLRRGLRESPKERAENLMIVDLMRNDLAQACEPGSIAVPSLYEVTTHPALHHLDSTVTGQRRAGTTTSELIRAAFPPGSMTGAPKRAVMQWLAQAEKWQRGPYAGALGWLRGDGACDLSVVIRTLLVDNKRFEFQVGGGIVADSDPAAEWDETLVKAAGIVAALGIDNAALSNATFMP